MRHLSRIRTPLCLLALGLAVGAVPAMPTASAQTTGSLSVSPGKYVGGQLITYSGNIGRDGVRKVKLQGNMGRPGDDWGRIRTARTDANGNFTFQVPAPAMRGVNRRVVAGGLQTNVVDVSAMSQDLVLRPDRRVVAGESFGLLVDTAPKNEPQKDADVCGLRNRGKDLPPPALEGRMLTLQHRVGTTWQDLATGRTDRNGQFTFESAGVVTNGAGEVYRVVQEDYDTDGNQIRRFSSFPTPVEVGRPAEWSCQRSDVRAPGEQDRTPGVPATTASQTRGWAPSLWDFGWEHGESLKDEPQRGKQRPRRGWWLDESDGLGRAARQNGGMILDSKRDNANGPGDHGSTWVTLRDNARRYGRWETRIRLRAYENNAPDYRARVELVPDADPDCRAQTITIADISGHSKRLKFGVNSDRANRRWKRTKRVGDINNQALALAVEVSKRHISWFVNGKVVGTVRSRKAVPRGPMTLRLSLMGKGQQEMDRAKAIYDWMRGFDLKRGKLTKRGHRLKARRYRGHC